MHRRVCGIVSKLVWKLHRDCDEIPILLASCEQPGVLGAGAMAVRDWQSVMRGDTAKEYSPFLRGATERDRSALYDVCLCTGDAGMWVVLY